MRKKKITIFALLIFCMIMYHDETKFKTNLEGKNYVETYNIETEETNY